MRPCRSLFSRRRSTSASALAANPIFRTNYSRRCVTGSADTWRKSLPNNRARKGGREDSYSDALVFFGATGDLAYKKIFRALQAIKRDHLNAPVIGVAKSGWTLDHPGAGARQPRETREASTRRRLPSCQVAALRGRRLSRSRDFPKPQRARRGRASGALPRHSACAVREGSRTARKIRVCEKRPRHHRKALRNRPRLGAEAKPDLAGDFPGVHLPHRPLCSAGKAFIRATSALRIRSWSRYGIATKSKACRSPWLKISGSRSGRILRSDGRYSRRLQNHLFQILANLAMEPPVRNDSESIRTKRSRSLRQ